MKSMTGYGRGEAVSQQRKIVIELKSVNHRYSDVNIKMPRAYIFLEETIRKYVLNHVSRGKIDVYLTVENEEDNGQNVTLNQTLMMGYFEAMQRISDLCGVPNDATAARIARFPEVLSVEKPEIDQEQLKSEVIQALEAALLEFVASRQREGGRIAAALRECAGRILDIVDKVEKIMPQTVEDYRLRLGEKVRELLEDRTVEETRLLTEVAIFSDRICTDEETVRLRTHLKEFGEMLEAEAPIGRKMDFLIQEMNREINTIGSKANAIEVSKLVVEAKSEIEKLREQVQNIE